MEFEDADDDEVAETGEEIRVMVKMELVSPEYPITRIQTRISKVILEHNKAYLYGERKM
jgi:hypothetical protein